MSDYDAAQVNWQGGEPPKLLSDRYRVHNEIGSGASAVTYRGLDLRLDRQVAIKILRRTGQFDSTFVQRFDREARLAASISNPHVVQVFDAGQHDGWLYLVMELVDGQDLKSVIERQGSLPASTAQDIAKQILAGLQAIHATGILHRDIKPQNVLLDRTGRVKVTDFGIAQGALDIGLTSDGTTLGTVSYMAPEQARGGVLSEPTDIYAVGVVLFEILTGRVPFERSTPMATMLAQIEDEPPRPSTLATAQDIAKQILAGLQAIHAAGILHRDIKPQNVLLDRTGRVKVTDFGIAQGALDIGLTSDGTTLGTVSYMAPEQARGGVLSEPTDIYAVGVVLFEMLTGRVPFERSTPMATMLAQIEDEPPRPSTLAPGQDIPLRLEGVVLQAMAKEPHERFRTATAMTRALEGALHDQGATTRLPASNADQAQTRVVSQSKPVAPPPSRVPSQQPPPSLPPLATSSSATSGGGRGVLTFVLVAILLAMVAIGAWLAIETLKTHNDRLNQAPIIQATNQPTPTVEPSPTEAQIIIPPTVEPPTPTMEPTSPPPTNTPPTEIPPTYEPEATEEIPIIEPGD